MLSFKLKMKNELTDNIIYQHETPYGNFVVFNQRPQQLSFKKVKQIHSNQNVNEEDASESCEADGIYSQSRTPLCIVTADCLPIFIQGELGHAMIHAGWKGVQQEILLQKEIVNLRPKYAFIGPHISVKSYEVGAEFLEHFKKYPESINQINEQYFFNLSLVAIKQLKSLNTDIIIEESGVCTLLDTHFHSYRRNKTQNRNWNIFIPN